MSSTLYPMGQSDADILLALRENRSWAVETVAQSITPVIRNKIYAVEDWEDVRQQCMVALLATIRRSDRIDNLWGLARRIAVCQVIDHNRKHVTQRARFKSTSGDEYGPATSQSDPNPLPSEALAARDMFLYVFQRLSDPCQRLFRMLFIDGATYPEAATALEITEGNLRVRVKRCREKAISIRDNTLGE